MTMGGPFWLGWKKAVQAPMAELRPVVVYDHASTPVIPPFRTVP
jgi:hypothetical protein